MHVSLEITLTLKGQPKAGPGLLEEKTIKRLTRIPESQYPEDCFRKTFEDALKEMFPGHGI